MSQQKQKQQLKQVIIQVKQEMEENKITEHNEEVNSLEDVEVELEVEVGLQEPDNASRQSQAQDRQSRQSESQSSQVSSSEQESIRHNWDDQMSFIRGQEEKSIKNPLKYKQPKYFERDWDNIAPVVSRMLIHLNKYMQGVCHNLHRDSKLENTTDLRKFAEQSLTDLTNKVDLNNENGNTRSSSIETQHTNLKNFSIKLRQEYDKWFKNSHYPELDEKKMVQFYRQFIAKDTDDDEEDSDGMSKKEKAQREKSRKKAVDQPRLISVTGFVDMFEAVGQNSSLSKRCNTTDESLIKLNKDISALNVRAKLLKSNIDDTEKTAETNRRAGEKAQSRINDKVQKQVTQVNARDDAQDATFQKHQEAFNGLTSKVGEMNVYMQSMETDQNEVNNELRSGLRVIREEMLQKIKDQDDFFQEVVEKINTELKDVRYIATEKMQFSLGEVKDHYTAVFETMRNNNTETKDHMNAEFNRLQAKVVTSIKNVKQVCSDWFAKTEMTVEENKIRQHVLEDKYSEWQRIVIEPQSLNDARLFSVESRISEEEEIRVMEHEFHRDLMKKLIYSLEQQSMLSYDMKTGDRESSTLPNLLGGHRHKQNADLNEIGATEIMMMKRMSYLHNQLDGHDSRKTTENLREKAAEKRDERILELWAKDQAKPSVAELVGTMRQAKLAEDRNDFPTERASPDMGPEASKSMHKKNSLFTQETSFALDEQAHNASITAAGRGKGLFEENSIQLELQTMHKTDTSPATVLPSRLSGSDRKGNSLRFKRNTVHNSTFQSTGAHSSIPGDLVKKQHHVSTIDDKFARHIFATKRDQENEQSRQRDITKAKRNASLQPFWKDYNEQIANDSSRIDPQSKVSVPTARVKARKESFSGNKHSYKFKNMGGLNKEMNQTQVIFSQKNENMKGDENLPTLVGSANTTHRILVPQDPEDLQAEGGMPMRTDSQKYELKQSSRTFRKQSLNHPSIQENM